MLGHNINLRATFHCIPGIQDNCFLLETIGLSKKLPLTKRKSKNVMIWRWLTEARFKFSEVTIKGFCMFLRNLPVLLVITGQPVSGLKQQQNNAIYQLIDSGIHLEFWNRMFHSQKHTKAFDCYFSTSLNLNLAWIIF